MAFSFGATPAAPAAGGFGSAGGFGAPSPSGFGAPAPSSGFGAPAPSSGFSFAGASNPAPAPFGSPSPQAFGSPSPQQQQFGASQQQQFGSSLGGFGSNPPNMNNTANVNQAAAVISCGTPYSALPDDIRQAIDRIHEAMMKHKRTVNALGSMGPSLLLPEKEVSTERVTSTPGSNAPLSVRIKLLNEAITHLERESRLQVLADSSKAEYETLLKQAIVHGLWQLEALAIRRGVHLRPVQNEQKQQDSSKANSQLQEILDRQMGHLDRIEKMPCQYLWQVLEDMKKRLGNLERRVWTVQQQSQSALRTNEDPMEISDKAFQLHQQVMRASKYSAKVHLDVENLKNVYRFYERGDNVLDSKKSKEQSRERQLDDLVRMQFVQAAAPSASAPQAAPGAASANPPSSAFGQPAPAPSSSAFGGGGAFGQPAPAPSSSGFGGGGGGAFSFGGTPAPASTFGGAPAPANTAAAPAGGAFGSSFATSSFSVTPKSSKNKSRSKSRSGR